MRIISRLTIGADGYVTTPDRWPAQVADRTIETFRSLGAVDRLEPVVLPRLLGDGMRLTPALSREASLTFESERALSGGSVEIVYALR
jgi:hypothetical protein